MADLITLVGPDGQELTTDKNHALAILKHEALAKKQWWKRKTKPKKHDSKPGADQGENTESKESGSTRSGKGE